jgi:hypothetical protein
MQIEYDDQVLVVRNYATPIECNLLTKWALNATKEGQFVDGVSGNWDSKEFTRVKTRLTNRMSGFINYCDTIYTIQKRLRNDFATISDAPVIGDHGKDGVVVSITYNDGDVYKHKDPSVGDGLSGARFNILSSVPENGGLIHVEDKTYKMNPGDLMAYLVTDLYHSVEQCYGESPRIMFMFGFCVPKGSKLI